MQKPNNNNTKQTTNNKLKAPNTKVPATKPNVKDTAKTNTKNNIIKTPSSTKKTIESSTLSKHMNSLDKQRLKNLRIARMHIETRYQYKTTFFEEYIKGAKRFNISLDKKQLASLRIACAHIEAFKKYPLVYEYFTKFKETTTTIGEVLDLDQRRVGYYFLYSLDKALNPSAKRVALKELTWNKVKVIKDLPSRAIAYWDHYHAVFYKVLPKDPILGLFDE